MTKHVKAEGTLSTRSGDVYSVWLNLTVAELHGETEIADETASRFELASDVPDGEYIYAGLLLTLNHSTAQYVSGSALW